MQTAAAWRKHRRADADQLEAVHATIRHNFGSEFTLYFGKESPKESIALKTESLTLS
jgi:hypothetical protein